LYLLALVQPGPLLVRGLATLSVAWRVFPANECEAWLAERALDASSDVEKRRSVHAEGLARTRRAPASLQALHHDHRGRQRGPLRLSAESRTR